MWFEKLHQLNIAIGMADSQEKRIRANRDFAIIMEIFIKKKDNKKTLGMRVIFKFCESFVLIFDFLNWT